MGNNYKQQDRDKILIYLQAHPVSRVEAIIEESGAERLRIYPILFELSQVIGNIGQNIKMIRMLRKN